MSAPNAHSDDITEGTLTVFGRDRGEHSCEVFFADMPEEAESLAYESRPGLDAFSVVVLGGSDDAL
jgi:hypothetical protein